MLKIFSQNLLYFFLILLLALAGGMGLFLFEKPDLIYYFSRNRTEFLNDFFRIFTKLGEEPVYLVAGILFLGFKIRYAFLVALLGGVVTAVSFTLKSYFSVDRPLAFFRQHQLLEGITLVPGVDLHSGPTSFPSGHSMSAFAFYTFLILVLPTRKRIIFPFLFLATGVAVSRVYLVQHFYEDIYVGSLIGVLVAVLLFWLDRQWTLSDQHFLEKPLFSWKGIKK